MLRTLMKETKAYNAKFKSVNGKFLYFLMLENKCVTTDARTSMSIDQLSLKYTLLVE